MPCETVTVEGPQITGDLEVTSFNVSTGVEQLTVDYEVTNNSNVRMTKSFEVTVDGDRVDSSQFQDVTEGTTLGNTVTVDVDVEAGESLDFDVCVEEV